MQRVRAEIASCAAVPWHVRIEGPTGSGKGVAARLLHQLSNRVRSAFIVCSLAALPDNLELSELVGYRRGAFTGAIEDRAGAFEEAHGGTCFLDEVGTASPKAQQALLRLVDEGVTCRLGERRDRAVDVRLVMATNEDLEVRVSEGTFREDLLARMGVLVIQMPPLAAHAEDIPELVAHILEQKSREAGEQVRPLGAAEIEALQAYPWVRNVRELEKAIEHYIALGRFPDRVLRNARQPASWHDRVDETLARCRGNKRRTAAVLGVSPQTLYDELRRRARAS
jgi:DNA-binding NtrC family response regulator